MQKVEIRKATSEFTYEIYGLVRETIKTVYPKYYVEEAIDFFLKHHNFGKIKTDIEQEKVYVIKEKETIVGTGTLDGKRITRVYIRPEFQEMGLGKLLMDYLESEAVKDHGAVWLDASLPANSFFITGVTGQKSAELNP